MKTRYIMAALAASLISSASFAQSLQTLGISTDVATLSMGGASTVAPVNGNATRTNAAAMAFYGGTIASSASFGKWAPSTADNTLLSAGLFFKFGDRMAFGLDMSKYDDQEYDIFSPDGIAKGKFKPTDLTAGLGAAYLITENLSAGVTGRFTSSSLAADASGNAVSADLSVLWKKDALKAGASLQNLGTKISYGGDSYMIPLTASAGASYEIAGITAMAQADYHIAAKAFAAQTGAQYSFKDMLFARAGFHFGAGNAMPTFVSLGAGAKFKGVGLDVCYLTGSKTLSNSFLVGLRFEL